MDSSLAKLDDLPLEIWPEVCATLSVTDILQIRATNKTLLRTISDPVMWKIICRDSWTNVLTQEDLIYDVPRNIRRNYDDVKDWCKYGIRCHHAQNHIIHRIEKLTKCTSPTEYWNKFDIILKNNYDDLLPTLLTITLQDYHANVPGVFSLDVRTCAQQLLDNITHKKFFDNLWYINDLRMSNGDMVEPLFMDFSKLDPSFYALAHHVLRVRQAVYVALKAKFNNSLEKLQLIRPALRVEIVCKELYKELKIGSLAVLPTERKYYNEDYFLSRIYSGEAIGHPLLILAIIQSICQEYEVETSLTEHYLLIVDDDLPSGRTLMGVNPITLQRQYYTHNSFLKMLCRQTELDEQTVIDDIIPDLLKPFTVETSRNNLFGDLSVECWGSLADPSNQPELSANSIYNFLPKPTRREQIFKLFPNSKQQIPDRLIKYIENIDQHAVLLGIHVDSPSLNMNFKSLRSDKEYKRIVKEVKNNYPGDSVHVYSAGLIHDSYTYLNWLKDSRNISFDPDELKQKNNFGTFTMYRSTELVCILTPLYKLKDLHYVTIMDCVGEVKIVVSNLLGDIVRDIIPITEYLATIMPHNELGYLFRDMDWMNRRLFVNDRIKSLYRPRSSSPGGAVEYDAKHIPLSPC
ncbi:similar to Saccharomyces cerevisiae YLR368W MDM30 F-box component of an SCF ubiquitin protein ligase complex [Maudiozyma saulgeensis]|uniref:Similar to Saccharomyces cerevisiae YLR368W MDM30 F-box component of an SCF ubiquitin protein ligase complex n=1 Tax=Maudiozyma saulgeensis TaxID=1789683 RepID=A0A1X7RB14_9SACH|nr:similar to Saccharomyces cerevisiae YLR368W MDM30 F-box component of an SCF ubiquitin protein ligase complex [Kazachstania saulgeensis]